MVGSQYKRSDLIGTHEHAWVESTIYSHFAPLGPLGVKIFQLQHGYSACLSACASQNTCWICMVSSPTRLGLATVVIWRNEKMYWRLTKDISLYIIVQNTYTYPFRFTCWSQFN
jgi:hypothetical protein